MAVLSDARGSHRDAARIRRHEALGLEQPLQRDRLALYLAQTQGSGASARYAVPARREDLHGLPPAWIGVGDIDLLHPEGQDYADRLQASDVEVSFVSVPGAPHGFESWAFDTTLAQDFIARAHLWLQRALESHGRNDKDFVQ